MVRLLYLATSSCPGLHAVFPSDPSLRPPIGFPSHLSSLLSLLPFHLHHVHVPTPTCTQGCVCTVTNDCMFNFYPLCSCKFTSAKIAPPSINWLAPPHLSSLSHALDLAHYRTPNAHWHSHTTFDSHFQPSCPSTAPDLISPPHKTHGG